MSLVGNKIVTAGITLNGPITVSGSAVFSAGLSAAGGTFGFISAPIRIRGNTSSNFTSENPVLQQGEMAYETDTGRFKFGNGTSVWAGLSYNNSLDFINVLEYGAKGDGTADDTISIQSALNAADITGKPLLFPKKTYLLTSGPTANQIIRTLIQPLYIFGNGSTLKCGVTANAANHRRSMFFINTNGQNLNISDLNFNGDNRTENCLFIQQSATGDNSVNINGCIFEKSRGLDNAVTLSDGEPSSTNSGLRISGPYNYINLSDCQALNHTREPLTAPYDIGTRSTIGIFISKFGAFAPKTINISRCFVSEIRNGQTGITGSNVDTDGISVLTFRDPAAAGATYPDTTLIVDNCTFINCQGRSVKAQCDISTFSNNTIKFNSKPIGVTSGTAVFTHGGILDCQGFNSLITNNKFYYDLIPGKTGPASNPFWPDDNPQPNDNGGWSISSGINFDELGAASRQRNTTIVDNIVYNNIPNDIGRMRHFAVVSEAGLEDNTPDGFVTIRNNKIIGQGEVVDFSNVGLRPLNNGNMYLSIYDNCARMQRSFMVVGSGANYNNNYITCIGNVNTGTGSVRHLINGSSPTTNYPAQITSIGNIRIGLTEDLVAKTTGFVPRTGGCAGISGDAGGLSIQSTTITGGVSYSFPLTTRNPQGRGVFMLVPHDVNGSASAMFYQSISGSNYTLNSIFTGANARLAATGSNLSEDSFTVAVAQNLEPGNTGAIIIRNNFTGERAWSLFSFG